MAGALVAFGVVAIVAGGIDSHACHEEGDETDLCDIGIFFGGLVFVLAVVVAAVIVTIMGGLGILLKDPIFIYVKPTIVNLFLSYLILVSFAFGVNIWKFFFKEIFDLPDRAWTILAIRWALFLQFLAFLNELIWRHITDGEVAESARWFADFSVTEGFWVNFKLVIMGLTLVFGLLNLPIVMKYQTTDEEPKPE